jgi:grpE|nr:nucleotide exchange factor GrpE [uncultured Capnocytophaga sp.]
MNTGHTHNEDDFYADDIHDADFQDAEIIDEEILDDAPAQEASYAQKEPQATEAQASYTQEETEKQNNNAQAEFAERQAEAERQASDAAQADEAISILEAELHKEKDKFMRLFAEFENYKRRTAKERQDLLKSAGQDVIQSLLPVLDDFDRALVEISKSEDENLLRGVELIHSKLLSTLRSKGLEEIPVAASDAFDSDIHEALTQTTAPTPELKGKIIDVVEKGYKLGEKIIRYPKVVVGQ